MHRHLLLPAVCAVVGVLAACPPSGDGAADGNEGEAEGEGDGEAPGPTSVVVFDEARIGSNVTLDNFQVVRADPDAGTARVSSATLVVDLGTTCFPFSNWRT